LEKRLFARIPLGWEGLPSENPPKNSFVSRLVLFFFKLISLLGRSPFSPRGLRSPCQRTNPPLKEGVFFKVPSPFFVVRPATSFGIFFFQFFSNPPSLVLFSAFRSCEGGIFFFILAGLFSFFFLLSVEYAGAEGGFPKGGSFLPPNHNRMVVFFFFQKEVGPRALEKIVVWFAQRGFMFFPRSASVFFFP